MSTLTSHLIALGDLFAAATGLSRATVSTRAFNDGKRLAALADGADIRGRRYEKAMAWFSAHWPEGTDWPAGIPRPVAEAEAPEAAE